MKKTVLFLLILTGTVYCQAQKSNLATQYASTLTEAGLMDHLSILASDALEGRETGERGQKMAAAFISDHFEQLGLSAPVRNGDQNSFYQGVPLKTEKILSASLTIGDKTYQNTEHMLYVGRGSMSGTIPTSDIIFVGHGTEESYEGLDVENKVVLLFTEDAHSRSVDVAKIAIKKGAIGAVMIRHQTNKLMQDYIDRYGAYFTKSLSVEGPTIKQKFAGIYYIDPELLPDLIGKTLDELTKANNDFIAKGPSAYKKIKPGKVGLTVKKETRKFSSENVLGYLEGSDLKDEVVVITAHYDHLGIRDGKVYNGADDDGSGTAAIMSLASAFAKAKDEGNGPRRSILFIAFTGEEKGLLGSAYYADNPVYPLSNTVTNLNLDMIGRNDGGKEADFVCLVGSDKLSTELHRLSEKANTDYTQLALNYVYNDENHPERIYYRSDHWNFAKNGVPIIFYTNLGHKDYHKESDTIEKIDQAAYLKITKLVFHTAWELAFRNDRPKID
jgi:hypothetical protein